MKCKEHRNTKTKGMVIMKNKLEKIVAGVMFMVGIITVFGFIGGCESETIDLAECILGGAAGLGLMITSMLLVHAVETAEYNKRLEREKTKLKKIEPRKKVFTIEETDYNFEMFA